MTANVDTSALAALMDSLESGDEAREAIERLDAHDIERIDQQILSALDGSWKKAGFVTAGVMIAAPDEYEELPESFYVLRIEALAADARVELKGRPFALKTSEIRLAS